MNQKSPHKYLSSRLILEMIEKRLLTLFKYFFITKMASLASIERDRAFDLLNFQFFTVKSSGKRYSTEVFLRGCQITQQITYKLQLTQNVITLIVTETGKFDHIIPVLKENGCNSQMSAWLLTP